MPTKTLDVPGLLQEVAVARQTLDALLGDSPDGSLFVTLACRAVGTSVPQLQALDRRVSEASSETLGQLPALLTRIGREKIGGAYRWPARDASGLRRVFPGGQGEQYADDAARFGTRLAELYVLAAWRLSRDDPARFGKIASLEEHEAAVARQRRKIAELRGALEAARARLREELTGIESALGQIAAMGV